MSAFFYAAALVAGIVSVFLRKTLLSDERLKLALEKEVDLAKLSNNLRISELGRDKLESIASLEKFEQKLLALLDWSIVPNIICWTINETIAVFGFVLAMLNGTPNSVLPFACVALLLNFAMFPKFEAISERARSLYSSF